MMILSQVQEKEKYRIGNKYEWWNIKTDLIYYEMRINIDISFPSNLSSSFVRNIKNYDDIDANSSSRISYNQLFLEAYTHSIVKWINEDRILEEEWLSSFENYIQYLSLFSEGNEFKIIYIGESFAINDLLKSILCLEYFNARISSTWDKLIQILSQALWKHWNPLIAKKYIKIIPELACKFKILQWNYIDKSQESSDEDENKHVIFNNIQRIMLLFKSALETKFEKCTKTYYPVELLKINTLPDHYETFEQESLKYSDFSFEKDDIIIRAYFKPKNSGLYKQALVRISDTYHTFTVVLQTLPKENKTRSAAITRELQLIEKEKSRMILITLHYKEYFGWINLQIVIKGKNKWYIDIIDIENEEVTSIKDSSQNKNLEHLWRRPPSK